MCKSHLAAVLMAPTDLDDGVYKLGESLLQDKISDETHLRNPEIDGHPNSMGQRSSLGSFSNLRYNEAHGAHSRILAMDLYKHSSYSFSHLYSLYCNAAK
jgi:hypothetical protein